MGSLRKAYEAWESSTGARRWLLLVCAFLLFLVAAGFVLQSQGVTVATVYPDTSPGSLGIPELERVRAA